MATRRKSIKQIREQVNRIVALTEYLATRDGERAARNERDVSKYVSKYNDAANKHYDREDKAYDAAGRYIRNIRKTKSYKRFKDKALSIPDKERDSLREKANNRAYSSRTYMGKNVG